MGQAKKRGSFEERKAQGIAREQERLQQMCAEIKEREVKRQLTVKNYIRRKGPALPFVAALALANSFEYRKL